MNERRPLQATEAPPPVSSAPELPVQRRPRDRKPFGAMEQRMLYPERAGYHRHWFNDTPGRIARAQEAGYEHVTENGKNVSRVVGRAEGGGGLIAYLMEIPEEWYSEDMAAQQSERDRMMAEIRAGRRGEQPGDNRYVPEQGIKITEGRR